MEEINEIRFKVGLSKNEFLRLAKDNPLTTFEKYPVLEIQEACLKAMDGSDVPLWDCDADWAEACIRDFLKQNIVASNFRERVLAWYVYSTRKALSIRAIEFAISLWQNKRIQTGELTKLIVEKLLDRRYAEPDLYCKVLSLRDFIEEVFNEFKDMGRATGYYDYHWYALERILRIIVAVKDFSFLDRIEEIILSLQEGKIWPLSLSPYYIKSMHLVALQDAKKILAEAKAEKEELKKYWTKK